MYIVWNGKTLRKTYAPSLDRQIFIIASLPKAPLENPARRCILQCTTTLMSDDGHAFDSLIFFEVNNGEVAAVYMHTFIKITAETDYHLSAWTAEIPRLKWTHFFVRLLPTTPISSWPMERSVDVENIRAGKKVLTCDLGV